MLNLLKRNPSAIVKGCAGITLTLSIISLLCWIIRMPQQLTFFYSSVILAPTTGFCFLLVSVCLFLLTLPANNKFTLFTFIFLNVIIGALSVFNLIHYSIGSFYASFPRKMLPVTSIFLLLTCLCIASAKLKIVRNQIVLYTISVTLSVTISFVSFFLIIGYVYGTPIFYAGGIKLPALLTLTGLLVINMGCIVSFGAESKLMRVLLSESVRTRLIRTFLPISILVVLLGGWFDATKFFYQYNNVFVHTIEAALLSIVLVIVIGTFSNVIGKRIVQAEAALSESEVRFKAISEQAMDGITLADMNGNYKFVNQAFCKMAGYTEEELLQLSVYALKYPDDETKSFNSVKELKQNIVPRKKLLCKDKSFVYADINGKVINILGNEMVLGIVRDVTKQVEDENELISAKEIAEASEKKAGITRQLYIDLVETAQDLIWQCDSKGRYIFLNHAWESTFGYKIEEMLGRPFTDFQDRETGEKDIRKFTELMQGGELKGFESIHRAKDGRKLYLVFNARNYTDEKGINLGTRGSAYDITEMKKLEMELSNRVNELEHWNNITLDREQRVIELKQEVNELLKKAGKELKYMNLE
jgi:PAS domain S-box-containing protein